MIPYKLYGTRLLGILIIFFLWQLLFFAFGQDSSLFVAPVDVLKSLNELIFHKSLLRDTLHSFERFTIGFVLAMITGVALGLFMGSFKGIKDLSYPLLDFFRSIPVTTLFPVFILFFGISDQTIISMVFMATVMVFTFQIIYGYTYAQKTYQDYMKSIGASKIQTLRLVIMPSLLPFFFNGVRISISYALIVVIVAEMFIGAEFGLGARIYNTYETYLIDQVYAIVLFVGLLGIILNRLVLYLEKRLIHWH